MGPLARRMQRQRNQRIMRTVVVERDGRQQARIEIATPDKNGHLDFHLRVERQVKGVPA